MSLQNPLLVDIDEFIICAPSSVYPGRLDIAARSPAVSTVTMQVLKLEPTIQASSNKICYRFTRIENTIITQVRIIPSIGIIIVDMVEDSDRT